MKTKKEIQEVLDDCENAVEEYELSEEGGDLINLGWIEALCYVLDVELCGCGKRPCHKNYTQCKPCLDEADRQHEALEGGSSK